MISAKHSLAQTAAPPSLTNSDFPSCVFWARFLEETKTESTSLADKIGTVTTLVGKEAGVGNLDATANAITCSSSAGNETYTRTTAAVSATLRDIGAQSVIWEVDADVTPVAPESLMNFSNYQSPTNQGILFFAGAPGTVSVRVGGADAQAINTDFTDLADQWGARRHFMFAWDRSSSNTQGTISLYIDGVLVETKTPPSDPGLINVASAAANVISPGWYAPSGWFLNGTIWNARMWYLGSIPSNMANVALQMAHNPDEFPALMNGVT